MPKRKQKRDLYRRAIGYGQLALKEQIVIDDNTWALVPGFPEYEVNKLRQVRRLTTKHYIQPYRYMMRPNEGEFVDFWINGRKHIVSLDTIMMGVFKDA